jgi:hypothetical protein
LPEKLQDTLRSLAEPTFNRASADFTSRVSVLLSSKLNISWIETVALRWHPVVHALKSTYPHVLAPNQMLVNISEMAKGADHESLVEVIRSSDALCARLSQTIALLDRSRKELTLDTTLKDLRAQMKPGAPALLRHIISSSDQILAIATDYSTSKARSAG